MSDYERSIGLTVNGTPSTVLVVPSMTLLDLVRTRLKLTGSKECCSEGECGACTMIVDGEPVNSCLVLAVEADGSVVVTIEGIGAADMTPVQESFLSAGAVQCGFCIPGMVVAATSLLERSPHPTKSEIREGMSGNLCRCGGYDFISTAVLLAAASGGSDG
jgi:aerobic-type carbon monoxide dehydrogenase small subunit (CoxS/CutS family)